MFREVAETTHIADNVTLMATNVKVGPRGKTRPGTGNARDIEKVAIKKKAIKDWAKSDRPREKLLKKGAKSLTDSELLAILLVSGESGNSAVEVARQILDMCSNDLRRLCKWSAADLMRINGIGEAKAAAILAAFELGRRKASKAVAKWCFIKDSKSGADYVRPLLEDNRHEAFGVLYLSQTGWVKAFEIISEGGITSTTVDPRIIFKQALEKDATSILVFHNHPSGNLRPSQADLALTNKLKIAADSMDIKLLDHIIVGQGGYFSFADKGLLH